VLKFSELVKDVLVPVANDVKIVKTIEIESANLFLNNLLKRFIYIFLISKSYIFIFLFL
jgi:hypothetical protein